MTTSREISPERQDENVRCREIEVRRTKILHGRRVVFIPRVHAVPIGDKDTRVWPGREVLR